MAANAIELKINKDNKTTFRLGIIGIGLKEMLRLISVPNIEAILNFPWQDSTILTALQNGLLHPNITLVSVEGKRSIVREIDPTDEVGPIGFSTFHGDHYNRAYQGEFKYCEIPIEKPEK